MDHHPQDHRPGSDSGQELTPAVAQAKEPDGPAEPNADDTIVALATPAGRGGIGVVRISGPLARPCAVAILGGLPAPRVATHRVFHDASGERIDAGLALWFPSPGSYTGEDTLELHGHGGPVVCDGVVAAAVAAGARPARAGEFTLRAFLNGKLDLAQAEAVADLIDASSRRAAQAALRSLEGEFSRAIGDLVDELVALRVYIEAALDFADEPVDLLAEGDITARLEKLNTQLQVTRRAAGAGAALRDGLEVAIVGAPNVGKSTLLNALSGHDAAIVSPHAGTTRDTVREQIVVEGLPLHIIDTAGLRSTDDPVEALGIARTHAAMDRADVVLWVRDSATMSVPHESGPVFPDGATVVEVHNKCDLLTPRTFGPNAIAISAKTGEGMDKLVAALRTLAGDAPGEEGAWSARRRHLVALDTAATALNRAVALCAAGDMPELIAEELKLVQDGLGTITGKFTSDDLLGEIFSSFCIGK